MSWSFAKLVVAGSVCLLFISTPDAVAQETAKSAVSAEQAAQSVVGKKVWIQTADGVEAVGTVVSASGGQVSLSGKYPQRVPLMSIRRIEVDKSHTRGMRWGLIAGGAGGAALGLASATTSDGTEGVGSVVGLGAALAAAGGLVGYAMSGGRTLVWSSGSARAVASVVPNVGSGKFGANLRLSW